MSCWHQNRAAALTKIRGDLCQELTIFGQNRSHLEPVCFKLRHGEKWKTDLKKKQQKSARINTTEKLSEIATNK